MVILLGLHFNIHTKKVKQKRKFAVFYEAGIIAELVWITQTP